MNHDDLRHWSKIAADWAHYYHTTLRDRPVRAQTKPGETAAKLPAQAPETPEPMERIFADFEAIVPDAMTHWQHPRFMAYFSSNAAPASMLAEQLANSISAMCMLWQTSPAATEIEEVMIRWLRDAMGLAPHFTGTIHDSATTATLSAVLAMREAALDWAGNSEGLTHQPQLRLYASAQNHSSVDKAIRIAGIGQNNLVKIPLRTDFGMDPNALASAIKVDRAAGYVPAGVMICVGGTSIGAVDPVAECIAVAKSEGLPTHVDAAWAGNAMICPEFRTQWQGIDGADSIVFNPYKWIGAQFDGAVQFLADPTAQIRTLGLRPDFLLTPDQPVTTDFNEWTVPLGRRFRALKLWFLLRAYGLEGLRERIRNHVAWAQELADAIAKLPGFKVVSGPSLSLFTFRYRDSDSETEALLTRINDDGRVYMTQTRLDGQFVIRAHVGQFDCTRNDVMCALDVLRDLSGED